MFNDGEAPLKVEIVQIITNTANQGIFNTNIRDPFTVPPRSSFVIKIICQAVNAAPSRKEALLVIESNDSRNPRKEISLLAMVSSPVIIVSPERLRFWVPLNAPQNVYPSEESIFVRNIGDATLIIAGRSFNVLGLAGGVSQQFELLDNNGNPMNQNDVEVVAGATAELIIRPKVFTEGDAKVVFYSNDSNQPQAKILITSKGFY